MKYVKYCVNKERGRDTVKAWMLEKTASANTMDNQNDGTYYVQFRFSSNKRKETITTECYLLFAVVVCSILCGSSAYHFSLRSNIWYLGISTTTTTTLHNDNNLCFTFILPSFHFVCWCLQFFPSYSIHWLAFHICVPVRIHIYFQNELLLPQLLENKETAVFSSVIQIFCFSEMV